ncbi:MAG TPA: hypothetical protein VF070_43960 [Streptosporangiaceae bacterium]
MKRFVITAVAASAALLAAGCGGAGTAPAAVPSLTQSANAAGATHDNGGGSRAAAMHAAAQCVRQHGIPSYQDPVLTPSGAVYTDSRSIENAPRSTVEAVHQACQTLLTQADLVPDSEPPAPPQLVRAGVRSAECMRAHGMPDVQDPTSQTEYTPGHGFGYTMTEMPAGGKASPVWQHAAQACRSLLDAEITASTLGNLGSDG